MGRRLPRAHEDDSEALRKRRLQVFKSFFQAYYEWQSLRLSGHTIDDILISPDGEEIYMPDLLTGYPYLPRRQQQSFELICMQSYTEAAATIKIYGSGDDGDEEIDDHSELPVPRKKRSSTVVQQYAQQALERMIEAFDQKQAGTWDPVEVMKTRKLNGKVVSHDIVAARRHRLESGSSSRHPPTGTSGDMHDGGGEDGDSHRGTAQLAVGS